MIEQVTPRRRGLMGKLVTELALAVGDGSEALGQACIKCGGAMLHKGQNVRGVIHGEGESQLKRTYYYCPSCKSGFFPLDGRLHLGEASWAPATIGQALRVGTEIASYERATESFVALTHIPMSKSSLQRLVGDYGGQLVEQQAEEATAMVKAPSKEEGEIA